MNEIQQLFDDCMNDFVMASPLVSSWGMWVIYQLESLEVKAMDLDQAHPEAFEDQLEKIKDAITDRLNNGRW